MKATGIKGTKSAFTMTELMIVVAVIAVVFLLLFPDNKTKRRSSRIGCVNNMKQVGLSFRLFATDNQDKFPFFTSTNDGGSMETVPEGTNGQVQPAPLHYMHFLDMSNELGTPQILQCPTDKSVLPVNNSSSFSNFNNQACSYFAGTSADLTQPNIILAGDKNLTNYQRPIGITNISMFITITTNRNHGNPKSMAAGFDHDMHGGAGNVALVDGSVRQVTTVKLPELLRKSERTQKFSFPESNDRN
jgi:prepilin-type N-terminal cleavage/methylation domain-containing protein/prepilin-type processing-associated H-X9-DG protein